MEGHGEKLERHGTTLEINYIPQESNMWLMVKDVHSIHGVQRSSTRQLLS